MIRFVLVKPVYCYLTAKVDLTAISIRVAVRRTHRVARASAVAGSAWQKRRRVPPGQSDTANRHRSAAASSIARHASRLRAYLSDQCKKKEQRRLEHGNWINSSLT